MQIYDISQEVFTCAVYPGDPQPVREVKLKISEGAICNLTAFEMCAHNGTHVDAPYHFLDGEETIDKVPLDKFIGYAYVAEHNGDITAEDAERILKEAKAEKAYGKGERPDAWERILVKGNAVMTKEGAQVFAKAGIKLSLQTSPSWKKAFLTPRSKAAFITLSYSLFVIFLLKESNSLSFGRIDGMGVYWLMMLI